MEDQLRQLAELGATDLLGTIFTVGGSQAVGDQDPGPPAELGGQSLARQRLFITHGLVPFKGAAGLSLNSTSILS